MRQPRRTALRHGRGAAPLRDQPPDGAAVQPPLIARSTADETIALGLRRTWFGDLYHLMLRLSWWRFLAGGGLFYLVANALFALLYLLESDAIANARPGSFRDAF